MPELRHLRYFVAVAEELNFSRAARRLHMSQPPLSAAIRKLEAELDVVLFNRTSHDVSLTAAGQALVGGARRALEESAGAIRAAQRAAAGAEGVLWVGFGWSTRFETLPTLGRAFAARWPQAELVVEELSNRQVTRALVERTVDVAVTLCPDVASAGAIASTALRGEALIALVPSSHTLAARRSVPLSALAAEQLWLFPRTLAPRLHDTIVATCRAEGFEPRLARGCFSSAWALGLLGTRRIAALVPESVSLALPLGLVPLRLENVGLRLETRLLWRAEDESALVAAFRKMAAEHACANAWTASGTRAVTLPDV
jgi:DNA-binding transcriptional LysR family regulator